MSGGIRNGFGHNVIRCDFGWFRYSPLQLQVKCDWNGAAAGEHLERRTETALDKIAG